MWYVLKRLALGLLLIAATAAILLISDLGRRSRKGTSVPKVAILQFASRPLLDENVRGMIAGLEKEGFADGKTVSIQCFNAENDLPTASTIAKGIVGGGFDLVLTTSTPCLQTMANANKEGRVIHVFCAVTDPFGAGVGINRQDPLDHPRHLVGVGTFQPVERAFEIAKQLYPPLKTVGVVWNPAEACSEACLAKARPKCKELGIELLEATVDTSSGVSEAATSLVARGVEAIWSGGDNTVELATDTILSAARNRKIPVFNHNPDSAERGILFAIGADYYEVGVQAGALAGRVLKGYDTRKYRIENVVPERLVFNTVALKGLKDPWSIPPELLAKASEVIEPGGKPSQRAGHTGKQGLSKVWKLFLVQYSESPLAEEGTRGLREGFSEEKLVEGRDFTLHVKNAQGDIATLNNIFDAVKTEGADLVMTFSTPTLQAALRKFDKTPIVFSVVADAVVAGAGRSETDHRPNVTGITTLGAFDGMAKLLKECFPSVRRVGTVYTSSERNSENNRDVLERRLKEVGIELVSVPANTSAEYSDAAMSMCSKEIDAVCQIVDNLSSVAFPSIALAAEKRRLPIFGFESSQARHGAVLVLARDYDEAGRECAQVAARVMRGASPAGIPFTNLKKARLVVNLPQARKLGLRVPEDVIQRADEVIGE